ncbi:hypothetical protein GQ53DRAFT_773166 [Thozetella sp. PMI_491]|nr:hypothetical protein GQ53DRAFT_773166 [Thozetella sp. PMI_491]
MFNFYTLGMQTRASGAADDEGIEVSPDDTASGTLSSTNHPMSTSAPAPASASTSALPPTQDPVSVPPQPDTPPLPSPIPAASSFDQNETPLAPSSPMAIDTLTRTLSRQNLQLDELASAPRMLPAQVPVLDMPSPRPWPGLEVDDEPHYDPMSIDMFAPGPLEADENPSYPAPNSERLLRQLRSQFHNNPTNRSRIQSLVDDMMTVSDSLPEPSIAPTPAPQEPPVSTTTQTPQIISENSLEPDPRYAIPDGISDSLQVDTEWAKQAEEEEDGAWAAQFLSLRRAKYRGLAKRQRHGDGIVTYEGAQATAFRCENVVRSRIRMRRRDKDKTHRSKSMASSVATSSVMSSPVVPPSIPSPALPPVPMPPPDWP